jgi:uncharacterized protein
MPQFIDPFAGVGPGRKLSKEELIRAIRQNLAAEEEAVHLYLAHADAADDPLAVKVLRDIADEERVHAGEFARLISILTGDEDKWLAAGAQEVDEMKAQLVGNEPADSGTGSAGTEPTVGSLIDPAQF